MMPCLPYQVVMRREHGGGGGAAHTTVKDQEGVRGYAGPGSNDNRSGGGRGGVVGDADGFEENPGSGDVSRKTLPVHLPNLQ